MAIRESLPGISPAKNEYGIEAGQILMQNIQERLTGLWPATGASSRRLGRCSFYVTVLAQSNRHGCYKLIKYTRQKLRHSEKNSLRFQTGIQWRLAFLHCIE